MQYKCIGYSNDKSFKPLSTIVIRMITLLWCHIAQDIWKPATVGRTTPKWMRIRQPKDIHTYIHTSLHLHAINSMKLYSCVSFRPRWSWSALMLRTWPPTNFWWWIALPSLISRGRECVSHIHTAYRTQRGDSKQQTKITGRVIYQNLVMYACQGIRFAYSRANIK